jgi:polysaccharide deacetylase 2 family uncharacterized protein YibQ
MDNGKNIKEKRTKKSSSINLIIGVVVGLLLCVGIGFLYASFNDTSESNISKNDKKQEEKINESNIIDWKQKSIEAQRKIDNILLSQQDWVLLEQKNGEKSASYRKDKSIVWNQRELLIGVPNNADLKEAIKWFSDELDKNKLYVLNKKEVILQAKKAYKIDIAMNNKINSEYLNCVTDKILFYNAKPKAIKGKIEIDKNKNRVITITRKKANSDVSANVSNDVILPIVKTSSNKKGALAIIIDDSGYSDAIIKEFADLPVKLTFSVLPFLNESKSSLDIILNAKKEAILHLPMEPINKDVASFDKMVTVDMTKEQCQAYVKKALDSLPGVTGVNNHQGSRATSSKYTMQAVLEILKTRGLFFVDSRTYSKSIAYQTAKSMGVKTAKNSMFLDNSSDINDIKNQLRVALKFIENGEDAIVICHARTNTYKALKEIYPELKKDNIRFKFVSEVVK